MCIFRKKLPDEDLARERALKSAVTVRLVERTLAYYVYNYAPEKEEKLGEIVSEIFTLSKKITALVVEK